MPLKFHEKSEKSTNFLNIISFLEAYHDVWRKKIYNL